MAQGPIVPAERPTLAGSVDLITGMPLLREVDFELPFGTTVFRHIRTKSSIPAFKRESRKAADGGYENPLHESGHWWDAAGYGWMLGHSPILLIDAAYKYWDIEALEPGDQDRHVERCIFLPDAHHSIPFRSLKIDGRYEAAPRFDAAILQSGGVFTPENSTDHHGWSTWPTEWTVWLQNRSIKYTIKPVYEDLRRDNFGGSLNSYPAPREDLSRHYGMPYYGVVTAIEDADGNRIEIDYCDFRQRPCDSEPDTLGCVDCCQECASKGMISRIRLRAPRTEASSPEGRVVYTILYVYQQHPGVTDTPSHGYSNLGQPAIAEVFVIPGEVANGPVCRQIPRSVYTDIINKYVSSNPDPQEEETDDPIEILRQLSEISWFTDAEESAQDEWEETWLYHVKYLYADGSPFFQGEVFHDGAGPTGTDIGAEFQLIQANVTKREEPFDDGDDQTEPRDATTMTRHTIYRHQWWNSEYGEIAKEHACGRVQAIFRHDTLQKLKEPVISQFQGPGNPIKDPELAASCWPLAIHVIPDTDLLDDVSNGDTNTTAQFIAFADQNYGYWGQVVAGKSLGLAPHSNGIPFFGSPFHREMVFDYLKGVNVLNSGSSAGSEVPVYLWDGATVHCEKAGGVGRAYRLHRFLMVPTDPNMRPRCANGEDENHDSSLCPAEIGEHVHAGDLIGNTLPQRAILHEPYMWRSPHYVTGLEHKDTEQSKPLWIAVIDEFENYDSLFDNIETWSSIADMLASEDCDLPEGDCALVPLTRRVVLMNPAGYVLSDRTYDIRNGGETDIQGMWEEYVYDWNDPDWQIRTGTKPIGRLVEHRSFGWSVAKGTLNSSNEYPEDDDVAEGLVTVYDYDLTPTTASSEPKTMLPGAIGIKWGTNNNDVHWLRQFIRDRSRPDLVLNEIEILDPSFSLKPYGPLSPTEVVTMATSGTARVTVRAYERDMTYRGYEDPVPTDHQYPVITELTVQPPAAAKPGGDLFFPISITHIDMHWGEDDNSYYRPGDTDTWTGVGAVTDEGVGEFLYEILEETNAAPTLVPTFDPTSLGAYLAEFYISVERKDRTGLPTFKMIDVDDGQVSNGGIAELVFDAINATSISSQANEWFGSAGSSGSSGRAPLKLPGADKPWVRRNGGVDALEKPLAHWAYTGYLSTGDLAFALDHTGRQTRVFRDVLPIDPEDPRTVRLKTTVKGLYRIGEVDIAFEPGEIVYEVDSVPDSIETGVWDTVNGNYGNDPRFGNILTVAKLAADALGRVNGVTLEDNSGNGATLEQKVDYGRFGEVSRERHHDGTIVRNLSDERGRLIRVYKGSVDTHPFWGHNNAANDNMILVESRAYGRGTTDANMLTETRSFRTRPAAQYDSTASTPLSQEGVANRTVYDWRGRPLLTRTVTPNGTSGESIVRTDVTFHDYAGQIVLTAAFAGDHPWGDDDSIPTRFPDSAGIPSVSTLLAASPISLEDRTYNPRGQVQETRTYNVEVTSGTSYLTNETYYDFAGRPVYSRGSGNIVTTNIQDAKGRQIRTSTWHQSPTGNVELSRTETAYDDKDQPFRVKSYERRHDALSVTSGTSEVAPANSIITYRYTWYDASGRVRTTIDIGTGDAKSMVNFTDDFDAATEPDADGFKWDPNELAGWINHLDFAGAESVVEPVPVVPDWQYTALGHSDVRISSYAYDDAGNQVIAVAPDGIVTRSRYNGYGQLMLQWENAPRELGASFTTDANSRHTAYEYSGAEVSAIGVLLDPNAIDPDWFSSNTPIELPWADEGTMLVSKVQHGAPVHTSAPSETNGSDPLATADSFGGSLLAALKYPTAAGSPLTILPSVDPDIAYTYYADGLLATRTDERGIIFKYYYDHAGRLTRVLADESNATTYLYNDAPPKDRVDEIVFMYDAATGRLVETAANDRDGGSGGNSAPISGSLYEYDPRGNLTSESQFHAYAILPTFEPKIEYAWNYEPASQGNRDRLASIQYPIPVPGGGTSTLNRLLTLSYGTAGSAADALSQVTAVTDSELGLLASFLYTGTGRRVAFDRGWNASALSPVVRARIFDNPIAAWDQGSSPSTTDYFGLNQFGQTRAVAYWREVVSGSSTEDVVLAAHRYAHDAAGRRTAIWTQHIEVAPPTGPPAIPVGSNERSQHFAYDALGRLVKADMGRLTGPLNDPLESTTGIEPSDLLPVKREVDWTLDSRDVWVSRILSHDADNDEVADVETAAHFVGPRNELLQHRDPSATVPAGSQFA
ncbi:MAG: RHS repeat protein, partial [Phycisphaeraceae bacterium]|nr:RHS repeat protein [Phycisphaeraceae bacterium]